MMVSQGKAPLLRLSAVDVLPKSTTCRPWSGTRLFGINDSRRQGHIPRSIYGRGVPNTARCAATIRKSSTMWTELSSPHPTTCIIQLPWIF